jgi:predicted TIM-barrel fold metal-dependent hydrolase
MAAYVKMLDADRHRRAPCPSALQRRGGRAAGRLPRRFLGLARVSGLHGMRGVRELEFRVREQKFAALGVSALVDGIPASDRRYYPLYAKACELDIPCVSIRR